MLFVKLATGQPKTKVQLRNENKHMSLPESWTDATLQSLGVARVQSVAQPSANTTHVPVNDGVEQVDGVWRQKWVMQARFTEYTDANNNIITVQSQADAYQQSLDDAEAAKVRATRDTLLAETDFYALSDVTMSAEMTTYRQALRDVPSQAGFPYTITWPDKP
jgi:hypothetical protein